MNILALDIATKCGYAHTSGPSGTWNLSTVRNESETMRLYRLRINMDALRFEHGIDLVVFEAAHHRFTNPFRTLVELQTIVKLWCDDRKIPYSGTISPAEIKKHATGKGNATKSDMLLTAQGLYPKLVISDDNHADALHLLSLATSLYGRN